MAHGSEIILRGTIRKIVYQNEENAYTVAQFDTETGERITLTGTIPMAVAGEKLSVTGHWETHPSHGPQFRTEFLERVMPEGEAAIEFYLASRAIKGIGPVLAHRIVRKFGERTLEVMEREPDKLADVPGITRTKAKKIGENFQRQFGLRKVLEYTIAHHLSADVAMRVFQEFGEEAIEAMEEDPYMLTEPEYGAAFSDVDTYAISLGVDAEDSRRLESAALFTLRYNLNNGHVFLPERKLTTAAAAMIAVHEDAVSDAIFELTLQNKVVVDNLCGISVCYLPECYAAETYTADRLRRMASAQADKPPNLNEIIEQVSRENGIQYAKEQLDAICGIADCNVVVLTGGPGTGKTTTIQAILKIFEMTGYTVKLAAPTGRAAKRLEEVCGRPAVTIHRLIECEYIAEEERVQFRRNEGNPIEADVVILDETSMVDILLMDSLLHALRKDARLVLVGDADQLPSVGPGAVLSDIIGSGAVPVVQLHEIFRQARESLIVMNAYRINEGDMPELQVRDRDFFFMPRINTERLADTIVELCAVRLPEHMGIPPEQIMVLSPTRRNGTGSTALNVRLQDQLNPPAADKTEYKYMQTIFRTGDRVMQIRNNYGIIWEKLSGEYGEGLYNGDIGTIQAIDLMEESMSILFDDKRVEYSFKLLNDLELAYAMTVHKSQGNEYRAVILAAGEDVNPFLLSRNILYTAVTRAKELLIIVGKENVIQKMVANARQAKRYSGLKIRLKELKETGS